MNKILIKHWAKMAVKKTFLLSCAAMCLMLVGCGGEAPSVGAVMPRQAADNSSAGAVSANSSRARASSSSSAGSSSSLAALDTQAPKPPILSKQLVVSNTSLSFTWEKGWDNIGIDHYNVSRDKQFLAKISGGKTYFSDKELTPNTEYTYSVVAVDLAGNHSQEVSVKVKTYSVDGEVSLDWQAPNKRVNGGELNDSDIAGYVLRYKLAKAESFAEVFIEGAVTYHKLPPLVGDYVMELATKDANGLLSEFVPVEFY